VSSKPKPIDKDAFDALLKQLINSPPLPLKKVVGKGRKKAKGK
jgi:hypothetical protein